MHDRVAKRRKEREETARRQLRAKLLLKEGLWASATKKTGCPGHGIEISTLPRVTVRASFAGKERLLRLMFWEVFVETLAYGSRHFVEMPNLGLCHVSF